MAGAPYEVPMSFSDDETITFTVEFTNTDGSLYPLLAVAVEFVVNDDSGAQQFKLTEGNGITKDVDAGTVVFNAGNDRYLAPGKYTHGCRIQAVSTEAWQQIWDGSLEISEGNF